MNKSNSGNDNDLNYKVYLDERKSLIEFEFEETRLFDKAILTLTAGAFGLSLALVKQIAPNPEPWTIPLLGTTWGGFSVSLLATLISFLTSQRACSKQLEILEAEYFPNNSQQAKNEIKNSAKALTKVLNYVSIIFSIVGVVYLAVFSIANITS